MPAETTTIRISQSAHSLLKKLSDETGKSMTQILDEAIKELQEKKFWEAYEAGYKAINESRYKR